MANLIYYNMMTPDWFSKRKDDWKFADDVKFHDLRVIVGKDTLPYEKICTIPLISGNEFAQTSKDITIRMNVGLELPGTQQITGGNPDIIDIPTKPTDPIIFLLSDGDKAMGMVIQDVSDKHHQKPGPYYGIQASVGPTALSNPSTQLGQELVRTTSKNNPDEFRITFKPNEFWGEAYSAIDGGHKLVVKYNILLDLSKGVNLTICRLEPNGEFKINYVEVFAYAGSKTPK